VAEIVCTECGTTNNGRTEFCSSCGAFLAWDGGADEPPPAAAPPPPAAPQPPTSSPDAAAPPAPVEPGYRYQTQATAAPPAAAPAPAAPAFSPLPGGPPPAVRSSPAGTDTGGFGYTIKAPPGRAVAFEPAGADPTPPAGAVATEVPPGTCPDCGTVNAPELRFCRRCGYQLFTADPDRPRPTTTPARPKRPWWQRWIPRRWLPDSEMLGSEARRAFRRSLPMGLRVRRWAYLGGALGLIVGLLYLTGANPVRWARDRIADIKGSVVEVQGVQAASEPAAEQLPVYPADQALDRLATAWASQWRAPGDAGACIPPGVAPPAGSLGSLVLTLPQATTVRSLEVVAGPPDEQQRPHQYRPKTFELTFSDGSCRQVAVADVATPQSIALAPITTEQIRVAVTDVYPPESDSVVDVYSITEIWVMARPR